MQVIVALSEVTILGDAFEIDGVEVPDRFIEYELNEWDEYALETAVQLSENGIASEVVTVTIGPGRSEETIRKGLAKGADRAIRIWDDTLENRPYLDVRTKAQILEAAIKAEDPALVLAGVQTDDAMFGATGIALAERLNFSGAAVVNDLTVDPDADTVDVHRELEGGREELATLSLPALCTIQTGINEPRYASLRGIRMAQRTPIETETLDSLGIDADDLTETVSLTDRVKPVTESNATIFEGEPNETAAALAGQLEELGVIDG